MTDQDRPGAERDAAVRAQYEVYPYPPRDPADERHRLVTGSPSNLPEVDHYLFAGVRDWGRPFRALFAGGGTGDGCIMLAQQLADRAVPAEVVHLDISGASQGIARARAEVRGLRNIRFVQGPLGAVGSLAPGPWDYVDCCGVLHHLEDPAAGLAALRAELDPQGGMGLMLYGELGRIGVYPVQAALRSLAGPSGDLPGRVALAHRLLADLPDSNWLRRNPWLNDHLPETPGEAVPAGKLFDLLLHPRDRAYTVPQLLELLAGAGLAVTSFIVPMQYRPETYLRDADLLARAAALDQPARWALAENLAGNMRVHVVYAVPAARAAQALARPDRAAARPQPNGIDMQALARAIVRGKGVFQADLAGLPLSLPLPAGAERLLPLIDGRRDLNALAAALGLDWFAFKPLFDRVYRVLNGLNLLLLRSGA
ncbi:MAG: class I SAM-dependent methyltransferase [Sneathiellaceae bacterium]